MTLGSDDGATGAHFMLGRLQEQIGRLRHGGNAADPDAPVLAGTRDDGQLHALVRGILVARRSRDAVFGPALFGEPAWDILLELFAAELREQKLSVSSACYASGVPATTALRWIVKLEGEGWLRREADLADARRCWLLLTKEGSAAMRNHLGAIPLRPA